MWWLKHTNVDATSLNIYCTRSSHVHVNERYYNDIVDDILEDVGRDLARKREEEIVESFTSLPNPAGCFTYIGYVQNLRGSGIRSTRS